MHNTNRLGCLTGAGFIAALITLFVLVGAAFASGGQMFSSGDLNAQPGKTLGEVSSHAEIKECRSCHSAPWERETMADRCLACHTEIAQEMLSVAELHGTITQKDPSLSCRDCHKDHRGKAASLTDLGEFDFPHDALGYSLNGHQRNMDGKPFECADCHGDDITTFASDSCQTCHRDVDVVFAQVHLLTFGADCLACHDGIDTYGDDFDHNRFSFQITGKHIGLDCSKCHQNARSISDMQVTLQDCYSCHRQDDPHDFAYGAECQACHSTEGWTPAHFDHNLSAFKLEGKHASVACEKCHVNNVFKGTPKDCYSCHKQDDEHNGQYGTQCETCHNPSDWGNATFDHARFAATTACVNCHAEPQAHAGRFGTDCASCHTTNAWRPASYNGPHTFPMNHGRGDGSCQTCHPVSLTTYTCYGCHEHNEGNIARKHREEGISDFQNCVRCHADGREHEGGEGGEGGDDD